jgi:uncharacterized protein (DUF2141 family)
MRFASKHAKIAVAALTMVSAAPLAAKAAELTVQVTGVPSQRGEVGCALHVNGQEFPTDNVRSANVWLPADLNGVTCRYSDVAPGTYAVAVSHDPNGNRRTDKNFLGIPTEAWGVSNNVRPNLRAPTFDESKFEVTADRATTITVRLK